MWAMIAGVQKTEKHSGREFQGTHLQEELIGGKPPFVK
jgi:hypothetical protein